jgi:RNA binding exosome subunit
MESIIKIFTTEDKDELKREFKKIISQQFEKQLEEMDVYLFNPIDIEEMIDEAFRGIISEIKIEFKEKLKEQVMKLLETNDIEKLLALKKKY